MQRVFPSKYNEQGQLLWKDINDPITRAAAEFAMTSVFCHNDILAGNILYHENWDRVRLIDYEYGTLFTLLFLYIINNMLMI